MNCPSPVIVRWPFGRTASHVGILGQPEKGGECLAVTISFSFFSLDRKFLLIHCCGVCARCLERNLKPEKVRLLETKHKRRHRFLVLQHHIIETLNVCIALSCFSPLHFMTLSRDLFENISSATRLDNPSSFNTPPLGRETRNPSRRESSG